jgi:hypothetical protein
LKQKEFALLQDKEAAAPEPVRLKIASFSMDGAIVIEFNQDLTVPLFARNPAKRQLEVIDKSNVDMTKIIGFNFKL